jgi:drug/metabolite transporter (DMT)-like permease
VGQDNDRAVLRAMPAVFVLIWSTGFVVARYGMPHAPPLKFLSLRYALSLLCFGAWIAWSRPAWPKSRAQWLHLAVCGALIHAGYLGGVWAAVKAGIGAGTVALIVGLQPMLTAVWVSLSPGAGPPQAGTAPQGPRQWPSSRPTGAATVLRGRGRTPSGGRDSHVAPRQWMGLLLGLAGLVLVVWRKLGGGEITAWSLALALFALLAITVGTLYQKRFVAPTDVRTANLVQLLAALVVTFPLAALEHEAIVPHPELIGALAWSVLGLTLGGSSLLYLLIQRGAATRVTSLLYLVPPCTAAMAWLLFGEPITATMLVGMALIAAGVALVVR